MKLNLNWIWLGCKDAGVSIERVSGGVTGAESHLVVRPAVGTVRPFDGQRRSGRHSQRDHLHGGRDDPRLSEQPGVFRPGHGHVFAAQNGAGHPPHVHGQRKAAAGAAQCRSLLFPVFRLQERDQSGPHRSGSPAHLHWRYPKFFSFFF